LLRHGTVNVSRPTAELPGWPLALLFAGYILWWALGLGAFVLPLCALPMVLLLALRGDVRMPRSFAVWLTFVLVMLTSVVALDSGLRLVGFALRAGNYLAVTVIFLYVYNGSRRRGGGLSDEAVVRLLVVFWATVVLGGLLGVVAPQGSLSTPVERILPASVVGNEYVRDLVHPNFAEVQQPWGAPEPFVRPSAPFPYTNAWGCNFALLLPFAVVGLSHAVGAGRRRIVLVLLALSVVPAFATLNRGMFVAVGLGIAYAAVRLAVRGRTRPLAGVVSVVVLAGATAWAAGIGERIEARTTYSSTTVDRLAIYTEAFERTLGSPLLGYGAPRPSTTLTVSVGTQGHVWNVMFSYGFLALACFLGWVWWSAWRSRHVYDGIGLAVHVTLVMASVVVFYYGFDGPQLATVFVASALAFRRLRGRAHRDAAPELAPARRPIMATSRS
jgi:hypothetical protein